MIEYEISKSSRLAHLLFNPEHASKNPWQTNQPNFAGLLERRSGMKLQKANFTVVGNRL